MQRLAGETVITYVGYGAFNPAFIAGVASSRRIDHEATDLRVLKEHLVIRIKRIGLHHDRLGVGSGRQTIIV